MSGWSSTYATGTVSIANGATQALGSGTMWSALDNQANLLLVNGQSVFVADVVNDTTLTIPQWTGTAIVGATYTLVQFPVSSLLATKQLRDVLTKLAGIGVVYYVSGVAPDDEIGDDGDIAIKINDGPFQFWTKIAGTWVLQGSPVGTTWKGAWNSATPYVVSDVVSRNGVTYISTQSGTNKPPESNLAYWDLYVSNGDRYDIAMFDTDRPASGELIGKFVAPSTITFRAGLTDSRAKAEVASVGTAVYSFRKNGVQFGTLTFTASATGVFTSAADAVFAAGDTLTIIAPSPRDNNLSGVAGTLVGYR